MTSPALGVAYSLWMRTRWMIAAALGTLLVFAVASLSMAWAREFILPAYLMVMVFELALVLNAFVYGPADLGAKASSFPSHMLVFPATTRELVGWPMLYSCVFHVLVWFLSAGLLLFPAGFHPPMIWTATMLAAVAVWVQGSANGCDVNGRLVCTGWRYLRDR
jgi:hypothetical protein